MSHLLPPAGHPARELFEVAALVDAATGKNPVPVLSKASYDARRFLARNPAVKSVVTFAVQADDTFGLFQIGKRGGIRKLWTFGKATRDMVLS